VNTDPAKSIIRWGILGTGSVARAFADGLRLLPDAALTAIGSRRLDRARSFASELGARHAHDDATGLARNDEVDVIYVATPHVQHRDDCLACLAGGRAVLCEKPFTVNSGEARAVIEQARSSQRFCMEAMWMRFHPLLRKVQSMVHSGNLGTIRLLAADIGYPTPFDPQNRFFDRRLGGGALLDRGVYLLSLADFLLGRPAEATGRATLGPSGVDEQASLLLTYPGGALAVLTTSLRSRLRNEALIVGPRGESASTSHSLPLTACPGRGSPNPSPLLPPRVPPRPAGWVASSAILSFAELSTRSAVPCGTWSAAILRPLSITARARAISSRPAR
jgi:predicted dehydrogenase